MFYEHRLATPLLLNIVKKTAGHSVVRPGIPNSCNSGIWWLLAILRHGIVHTEPWEVQGFSFVLILNVSELCSRRWKLIMTTEPRAHIFWFCSTELNSPNSISLRLLFLFSMQVCSMCLVKLLLPTALSLISISFLRKRDWLGDPIAQCSRCQLKDAWIRASSPLAASPWSSTPSWRDRRISKNSGWFRFENFFNRKSNIWHMYHRQKKRSCKESSVRWRRWWGSWTGQSINSSPTQYFCSLFILLLFSSCGSHSLCWLHRRGPIGGLGSLPATHRAGGAEEGGLWVKRGGQCSVLAGQVWRRRGLCQIHSRPQGLSTQCF